MTDLAPVSISITASLIEAFKQMDAAAHKMLLVFDGDRFRSIVTVGDIQRAIIDHIPLDTPVEAILDRSHKVFASTADSEEEIRASMMAIRAELMPVLDSEGQLARVYSWTEMFGNADLTASRPPIDLPVVVMAGGKGTRLRPITNVIPKPLVPVGDKTILEEILDRFEAIGCHRFYMSVGYKSDMLRFYLNQAAHPYNIEFFEESKPLGTIGSVSLLKGRIDTPFFVTNCDIIIDQDMRDVFDYHLSNHNDLTIVAAVKSFHIPYGVIETGADGLMTALKEKPELTYMINSGVYILSPQCIDEIPQGQFFHITHLMEKIKARGGRVGCFPISEHSWRDMGEWPEYLKMINVL